MWSINVEPRGRAHVGVSSLLSEVLLLPLGFMPPPSTTVDRAGENVGGGGDGSDDSWLPAGDGRRTTGGCVGGRGRREPGAVRGGKGGVARGGGRGDTWRGNREPTDVELTAAGESGSVLPSPLLLRLPPLPKTAPSTEALPSDEAACDGEGDGAGAEVYEGESGVAAGHAPYAVSGDVAAAARGDGGKRGRGDGGGGRRGRGAAMPVGMGGAVSGWTGRGPSKSEVASGSWREGDGAETAMTPDIAVGSCCCCGCCVECVAARAAVAAAVALSTSERTERKRRSPGWLKPSVGAASTATSVSTPSAVPDTPVLTATAEAGAVVTGTSPLGVGDGSGLAAGEAETGVRVAAAEGVGAVGLVAAEAVTMAAAAAVARMVPGGGTAASRELAAVCSAGGGGGAGSEARAMEMLPCPPASPSPLPVLSPLIAPPSSSPMSASHITTRCAGMNSSSTSPSSSDWAVLCRCPQAVWGCARGGGGVRAWPGTSHGKGGGGGGTVDGELTRREEGGRERADGAGGEGGVTEMAPERDEPAVLAVSSRSRSMAAGVGTRERAAAVRAVADARGADGGWAGDAIGLTWSHSIT